MRSKKIKLLHEVAGRPMVHCVLDSVRALRPRLVATVVGFQAADVKRALADSDSVFVLQKEQRGTGHAVLQAASILGRQTSTLLILSGDVPAIRPATLKALIARHRRSKAALTVLTTLLANPTGYGRVVRDSKSRVSRIVEHRDADAATREIREINAGIYCARPCLLMTILRKLRPHNAQGEYYLTDAVHELIRRGETVIAVSNPDPAEVLGVNTRAELAEASRSLYARKARELQAGGVTLLDPSRISIDPRARIGRDSIIHPDVLIEGETVLGEDCVVRSGSRITDCRIGRGVLIKDHCVLTDSRVGDGAELGPFAHLRPASVLGVNSRVGNFVELKKTRLGRGTKASHLSYLGDAVIGPGCNIGAGTITCNYDGEKKHRTTMAADVFVGSDTQFIAPVRIGRGAYVAAGSTVTDDVPAGSLAVARSRQTNVRGWVARRKKK